ncbi:MAG TPA: hypothetical protein VMH87_11745 [Pseudomonadales bacterium]|nr:hypothetical protein [Pseudomonadales bacterium]
MRLPGHKTNAIAEKMLNFVMMLAKAYLVAVPLVLLICCSLGYYKSILNDPAYGMLSDTEKIAARFKLIEGGYILCFFVLLLASIKAFVIGSKNGLVKALALLIINVVSGILLYPTTLIASINRQY